MPGDLERLSARLRGRARRGPAAMAAELLGRVRAELPVVGYLWELVRRRRAWRSARPGP